MAHAQSGIRIRSTFRQRRRQRWQRRALPLMVLGWAALGLVCFLIGNEATRAEPSAAADRAPTFSDLDARKALATAQYLTQTIGARPGGSAGERRAATYLRKRLSELGYETRLQRTIPLAGQRAATSNVIGIRRNPLYPKRVLIGAHYDSKCRAGCVGANDNASGVGVTLELARVLADAQLPYSIEVAFFGAEEQRGTRSLVGSKAYVARCQRDLPMAMLCVDMVGRGDQLSALYGGGSGRQLAKSVHDSARSLDLPLRLRYDATGSDHVSFAAAGVPSVWLWRGPDSANHTWRDQAGRLQPEALEETGRLLAHFLLSYGRRPSPGATVSHAGSADDHSARPGSLAVAPECWSPTVVTKALARNICRNATQVTDPPADIPGRRPLSVFWGLGGNYGRSVRTAIRGSAFAANRLAAGRTAKPDTGAERARPARAGPVGAG